MLEPVVLPRASEFVIACGTSEYADPSDALPSVRHDVDLVTACFENMGYVPALKELRRNPPLDRIRLIDKWFSARQPDDKVIFYYSGHGITDGDRHYLLLRDSDPEAPDRTALPCEELARLILKYSRAQQILLILDTCYSGRGTADIEALATRLSFVKYDAKTAAGLFLIAAARMKEEAAPGAFAAAFTRAIANQTGQLGMSTQEHIDPAAAVGAVNHFLREHHPHQTALLSSHHVTGPCTLLRNSRYSPGVRAGSTIEVQSRLEYLSHWVPKSRGTELGSTGWHFSGRKRALRELVTWLRAEDSGGRPRIITGAPGTGKSALLSRIVTLADPESRSLITRSEGFTAIDEETIPPEGGIDIAIHAKGRTLRDIIVLIAEPLEMADVLATAGQPDPESATAAASLLLQHLNGDARRLKIVVDALDEASNPAEISRTLLANLAGIGSIWLMIGMRPDHLAGVNDRRVKAFGSRTVEIDLDEPQYREDTDVEEYVFRRLVAIGEPERLTPYRGKEDLARSVARAVATKARGVFLIARIISHTLASAVEAADLPLQSFPEDLGAAFDQHLDRFDQMGRPSREQVVDLLEPLAWAFGQGFPWENLWAPVANAVSGRNYSDPDIRQLLVHAAAWIVEANEGGRSVYRLYHESLAEHLRDQRRSRDIHGRITCTLRTITGGDWFSSHPYVRAHLAEHATAAGELPSLLSDPGFLLSADPDRLLPAIESLSSGALPGAGQDYRRAVHTFRNKPAWEIASYLEMSARQRRAHDLAHKIAALPLRRRWTIPWAWWDRPPVDRILASGLGTVYSLSLARLADGQQVVISGSMGYGGGDSGVRFWDLATGALLGAVNAGFHAVATFQTRGRWVVGCGGIDGSIQLVDVVSRQPVSDKHYEESGHYRRPINSVVAADITGFRSLVSGSGDGTVAVWDLTNDEPRPFVIPQDDTVGASVERLATGAWGGSTFLAAAGRDGLRVWDLEQRQVVHHVPEKSIPRNPARRFSRSLNAVALITLGGAPAMLFAISDPAIWLWPLSADHGQPRAMQNVPEYMTAGAVGELGDAPVIVAGGISGSVGMWNLLTGERIGVVEKAHDRKVTSVVTTEIEGRPVAVSGGEDGSIRVWELSAFATTAANSRLSEFRSIAASATSGRNQFVTGHRDGTIRFWDAHTGTPSPQSISGSGAEVTTLCFSTVPRRPSIVAGYRDGIVRVWNAVTGECIRELEPEQSCSSAPAISSVEVVTTREIKAMIAADAGGSLRLWNLRDWKPMLPPFFGHSEVYPAIYATALTEIGGNPTVITAGDDGTIRFWRLPTLEEARPPIKTCQSLRAVTVADVLGMRVVISGENWEARYWELEHGTAPVNSLQTQLGVRVVLYVFIEDQHVVITGCHDQHLRIWSPSGELMLDINLDAMIISAAFMPPAHIGVITTKGLVCVKLAQV